MIDFKRDNSAWAFAVVWTGFVLVIDSFIGSGIVEAVRSEWFDTTPGAVTKSALGRGRSADFHVEYTYAVNGRQYTGTKYHVQPQFVGSEFYSAARDANPVGAQVTVHYDPADPADAYLLPGLRSDAVFCVWWLVPFNLVSVGFAWGWLGHLTGRRAFDPARRRCARQVRNGWLVRPDPNTAFMPATFLALGLVTFFGCFVAGACSQAFGLPPPWWVPLSMLAVAVVVPVAFGLWQSRHALVHIDADGTVSFPDAGRRVVLHREQLRGADVSTEVRRKKGGTYTVYAVTLRWRDRSDANRVTRLAEYADTEDALALAAWLNVALDLPAAPAAD